MNYLITVLNNKGYTLLTGFSHHVPEIGDEMDVSLEDNKSMDIRRVIKRRWFLNTYAEYDTQEVHLNVSDPQQPILDKDNEI